MAKREYVVTFPVRVTVTIDLPEGEEFPDEMIKDSAMSCVTQTMQVDSGLRENKYDKDGNRFARSILWADLYAEFQEEDCEIEL